jgi:predicted nucleic-acid-binding Zn-ribbon protein
MRWLLKTCSKTLCNFAWLGQTVATNLKFNEIFDVLPKMCLEVIIDNCKPVEFMTLHVYFEKSTVGGKPVIKITRPIYLKKPIEVIIFFT